MAQLLVTGHRAPFAFAELIVYLPCATQGRHLYTQIITCIASCLCTNYDVKIFVPTLVSVNYRVEALLRVINHLCRSTIRFCYLESSSQQKQALQKMLPVLTRLDVEKLRAGMQMFGSQRLSLTSLHLTFPNPNACSHSGTPECPSLLRTLSTCLYFTLLHSTIHVLGGFSNWVLLQEVQHSPGWGQ